MRCPECARQTTRVKSRRRPPSAGSRAANATYALIAINVVVLPRRAAAGRRRARDQPADPVVVRLRPDRPRRSRTASCTGSSPAASSTPSSSTSPSTCSRCSSSAACWSRRSARCASSSSTSSRCSPGPSGRCCSRRTASQWGPRARSSGSSPPLSSSLAAAASSGIAAQIGILLVINFVFTFSIPGISIGGTSAASVGGALAALAIVAGERGTARAQAPHGRAGGDRGDRDRRDRRSVAIA